MKTVIFLEDNPSFKNFFLFSISTKKVIRENWSLIINVKRRLKSAVDKTSKEKKMEEVPGSKKVPGRTLRLYTHDKNDTS